MAGSVRCPPTARGAVSGALRRLGEWFYEVETLMGWAERRRVRETGRMNAHYSFIQTLQGENRCSRAFFTMSCGGRVRFEGQERWLCADRRGRWSPEVLQFEHTPVVAVDLRGSQLTYDGLDNLGETPPHFRAGGLTVTQQWGWGSQCHPLNMGIGMGVSLPPPEHRDGAGGLSVTPLRAGIWMGPPTVGGAVKCVPPPPRKLQYLDVGGLSVPSPGLLRILLEEMLPHCQVVGMDMGDVGDMGEGDPTETPPRDSAVMGGGVEVALNALRSLCCV
ncbi:LOW QUALITY PROTEIN: distal membrane-arm assembly complex protein 2 [Coturnix japonica]|uniref:LOW QUALITY PROTEIN: distal membrane-arm assembly complex protein 2 n=1 Tax=Coturnix japonica TaxID=93934 RepID=UPI0013A5C12D|nr:LOW QUALITY PROTEIN: distal membrane-arm assembly complex protein 2 [Coturnix japonica]